MNPSNEIDLVIILDNNSEEIKSIYTMIENRFLVFFGTNFMDQLKDKRVILANSFDGMFV